MRTSTTGKAAAAFFALLPFFSLAGLFYPDVNSKFFLGILFVDALLLAGAYRLSAGKGTLSLRTGWLAGALLLALGSQALTALTGVFVARSFWSDIFWSSGVIFLAHIVALVFLAAWLLTKDDWRIVRRAIALSAGAFGLLTIIGVNGLGADGTFLWLDLGKGSLTLGNETYAGAYLVVALIIALIELARTERKSRWYPALISAIALTALSPLLIGYKALSGFASPLDLLGLARSSSGAMLLLFAFLGGHFALARLLPRPWNARAGYAWGGVLLAMVSLGVLMLFTPGSRVQDAYIEASSAARIIVWESSARAIADRPLLGWGPENFNIASERHFDTRLFYEENYGEIWFERAHNAFMDVLVGSGFVGLLAFALLMLTILAATHRARTRGLIGETEAALLFAFPFVHLVQLQTGFDTISSYLLLAFLLAYLLSLEEGRERGLRVSLGSSARTWLAGALAVLAIASVVLVLAAEYGRQRALFDSFDSRNPALQRKNLEASLARLSSFEPLRLSSGSFLRGSLASLAERSTPERVAAVLDTAAVYEERYEAYLLEAPEHYRARVNYAYLLLIETTLGRDRLARAKEVLEGSYPYSPGNPITPALLAVAELYSGHIEESDRLMEEALALDPKAEFTQGVAAYLTEQERTLPNIGVLNLTNL